MTDAVSLNVPTENFAIEMTEADVWSATATSPGENFNELKNFLYYNFIL